MRTLESLLMLLLMSMAAGCEHFVEANSGPSEQSSESDDQGKEHWWQRVDWNKSDRGTPP